MRKRRLLYIVCLLGVFWLNVIYVEYQFFLLLVLLIVVPAISGVLFELAANGLKLYLNIPQKEVHPGQLVTVCIKAVNRHVIFLGKQQFQIGVVYLNTPGNEKEMLQCDGVTEKYSRQWRNLVQSTAASHKLTLKSIFAGLSGADWYTKEFSRKLPACRTAGAGFIHADQDGDGKTAGIPLFSGSR